MYDTLLHWCCLPIVLSLFIGLVCHFIVRQLTTNKQIIIHVDEFFGNFVSSVFILESFVIGAKFGGNSYEWIVISFIHLLIKNLYFMTFSLYANPLSFFDIYYTNKRKRDFSVFEVLTILLTQVIAVLAGQHFTKFVWTYEDPYHLERLRDVCMATLSPNFTWKYAAVMEGFGVFLGTVIDFFLPYRTKAVVRSVITISLILCLGHVSGLWMNPILASVFTFRCKGHGSDLIHFIVYWLGPMIGFACAWEVKLITHYLFSKSTQQVTSDAKVNRKATSQKKDD